MSTSRSSVVLLALGLLSFLGAAAVFIWGDVEARRVYGRALLLLGGGFLFVGVARD